MTNNEITTIMEAYPQLDQVGIEDLFDNYSGYTLKERLYYHNIGFILYFANGKGKDLDKDILLSEMWGWMDKIIQYYDYTKGKWSSYFFFYLRKSAYNLRKGYDIQKITASLSFSTADGEDLGDIIPDDSAPSVNDNMYLDNLIAIGFKMCENTLETEVWSLTVLGYTVLEISEMISTTRGIIYYKLRGIRNRIRDEIR